MRRNRREGNASRITRLFPMLMAALLFFLAPSLAGADEDAVLKKGGTTVDTSAKADGYVRICQEAGSKRYKLRITHGEDVYTYDLNNQGAWEIFPLQLGVGEYRVQVYRQQSGKQYSAITSLNFAVDAFNRENACFLVPNQYVNYTMDSDVVQLAKQTCQSLSDDKAKADALADVVLRNIQYDYIGAMSMPKGYLPDVDAVLKKGMGICLDYAAVYASMLRSQGIAAQLVIGYADKSYHAWNLVWLDGAWTCVDLTAQSTAQKYMTYTTERFY